MACLTASPSSKACTSSTWLAVLLSRIHMPNPHPSVASQSMLLLRSKLAVPCAECSSGDTRVSSKQRLVRLLDVHP